jgi:hypothetical protein
MKIDRLNTGQRNHEALIGYFEERGMGTMVKWLKGCLIRFDTINWKGREERIIVEIYVKDVPEPEFNREETEEETKLSKALKDLCDPETYLGFYLFQLEGRLWQDPHRTALPPREESRSLPASRKELDCQVGLNNCFFPNDSIVRHDELQFRSPAEISVYDELRKRKLLFFPNAAAVLGEIEKKREPDFLICYRGKWGVLEVMGEMYHTNAVKDHERARLFKDYGLLCIEFFSAKRCENEPAAVVDQFLAILARH